MTRRNDAEREPYMPASCFGPSTAALLTARPFIEFCGQTTGHNRGASSDPMQHTARGFWIMLDGSYQPFRHGSAS